MTTDLLSFLLELLDNTFVDAAAFVDEMASGGRFAGVDVANHDDVNVELFFTHFEINFSELLMVSRTFSEILSYSSQFFSNLFQFYKNFSESIQTFLKFSLTSPSFSQTSLILTKVKTNKTEKTQWIIYLREPRFLSTHLT